MLLLHTVQLPVPHSLAPSAAHGSMTSSAGEEPTSVAAAGPADHNTRRLARALGSTDWHLREHGVTQVLGQLAGLSSLPDPSARQLWKGLFYAFWHSDKAKVQVSRVDWGLCSWLRFTGSLAAGCRRSWQTALQQQRCNCSHRQARIQAARSTDWLADLSEVLPAQVQTAYLRHFFLRLQQEWMGIDRLRLDKFMLLTRKFVHRTFTLMLE